MRRADSRGKLGAASLRAAVLATFCVAQGGYGTLMAWVPATHPGLKQIKADLLTAFVKGTPVSLKLIDTTCQVDESMPRCW